MSILYNVTRLAKIPIGILMGMQISHAWAIYSGYSDKIGANKIIER
jgi:hypothetical protein